MQGKGTRKPGEGRTEKSVGLGKTQENPRFRVYRNGKESPREGRMTKPQGLGVKEKKQEKWGQGKARKECQG